MEQGRNMQRSARVKIRRVRKLRTGRTSTEFTRATSWMPFCHNYPNLYFLDQCGPPRSFNNIGSYEQSRLESTHLNSFHSHFVFVFCRSVIVALNRSVEKEVSVNYQICKWWTCTAPTLVPFRGLWSPWGPK